MPHLQVFLFRREKMYKKIDGGLNCYKNEQEILRFWEENNIKEKCLNHNKDGKIFRYRRSLGGGFY